MTSHTFSIGDISRQNEGKNMLMLAQKLCTILAVSGSGIVMVVNNTTWLLLEKW